MHVYSCATPSKGPVCQAWAAAHHWKLIDTAYPFYMPGDCAVWGLMRGAKTLRQACRTLGHNYYALDNGYLRRGKYFRVTRNGYAQSVVVERPDDRWKALGIALRARNRRGSVVMVALSSSYCYDYFGCQDWPTDTIVALRRHTARRIVIRNKELYREIQPEELADVYCVVTHSSGIALDALINGVPAIVTGPGAASAICERNLENIESVELPDEREALLRSLAYAQFRADEFALAKTTVDELNAHYDHL